MTIGQRIAGKRKELGLSQEGLGEKLGVSRQAIYKWEADATLPEIDKLVALSRLFSVSVGWILGVEDTPEPSEPRELTPEQLQMVEEIVGRYLDARPEPRKKGRRGGLAWGAVVAAVVAILAFRLAGISHDLSEVRTGYYSLQNSIWQVERQVGSRVDGIAASVEDILKKQNQLTADYGAEIVSADLTENTVTFRVWAVPKTYTEGMTAVFTADNGVGSVGFPGKGEGNRFTAEVTCPLTDEIRLVVAFVTGDKRETQYLETFTGLYRESFPQAYFGVPLWFQERNGVLINEGHLVNVEVTESARFGVAAETVRCGLFRDRALVYWYEPAEIEGGASIGLDSEVLTAEGKEQRFFYFRPPAEEYTLEPGHSYWEAAVITDSLGRERVYPGVPVEYSETDGDWKPAEQYLSEEDPANWTY